MATQMCEISTVTPRNVVMRKPLFCYRDVSIKFLLNDWFQIIKKIEGLDLVEHLRHVRIVAR